MGPTPSATLPVHLLGPTPMTLSSTFGAGPGASVGATNPGFVAQLCTGTRSRLRHQLKPEIEEPRDLKSQCAAQKDQYQARGTRYRQEKGLPCRAGEPGKVRGHHQKQATRAPRPGLPGITGAEPPHQPLKHNPYVVDRCDVKPQGD